MPIDLLGSFFPPPARLDPDRPQRVGKTDRDGGSRRQPNADRNRRKAPPNEASDLENEAGDAGHHIAVDA
jgi:hypothetical protein